MTEDRLYNRILSTEAVAQMLVEECRKLRSELRPVSTGMSKNTAIAEAVTRVLAKSKKTRLKKAS